MTKWLRLAAAAGALAATPVMAQPGPAAAAGASSFGFAALNVTDMVRSLQFYRELGLVEQFRSASPEQVEVGLAVHAGSAPNLLLVSSAKRKERLQLGNGFSRVAFLVRGLDELCRRFTAEGRKVRPPVKLKLGGIRVAFVEDPDGYRVELIETGQS